MRVRHQQVAISAEGKPGGLAVGEFGSLPATKILSVRGENGNSGRNIDNVEVVVLINRDRPRLLELAFGRSRLAPDGVEPARFFPWRPAAACKVRTPRQGGSLKKGAAGEWRWRHGDILPRLPSEGGGKYS